ncbi:hypothetical protein [Segetibacter aerophilus]|uniref:Uncharacterized protein n=1 Tax=Segetibacter aerophilus TaxID=670293 RepID=A0A512BAZ5_9BACT|nr:hypothetical protein [Segetibacter aerophilus]GEO09139.1 hypothetical protein SAE01_16350 [Segetibacter aerophilus]
MKQREITDSENTRWTCVQAFSMSNKEASEKAEAITETEQGKVTVVCTPTGGAKTVRLELDANWEEQMTDEHLSKAITSSAG